MTQWGLDVLFNPAKRHMDEEKRRLQSTREEVGDNSGGRRIDLESGKVTIPKQDETDADDAGSTEASTSGTGGSAAGGSASGPSTKSADELTPAQLRALKRRGREPRS